jgi:hypothetical protein
MTDTTTPKEATRARQTALTMHGCIVLTLGLLAGVGFSYAAATAEPASQLYATWHFAHLEGLLNGVVVLAIAGTWPFIEDHQGSTDWGRRLLIVGAYANAIGPWITALFVGHRVINPHGLLEYFVVYGFYIPGAAPMLSLLIFSGSFLIRRFRPINHARQ